MKFMIVILYAGIVIGNEKTKPSKNQKEFRLIQKKFSS